MTNHIGRSIKNNPIEWALFIVLFFIIISALGFANTDKSPPVCVVEATPVQ